MKPQILASLARVQLARGATGDALASATEAAAILEELGGVEEGESLVRLMLVETLLAAGERTEAIAAARSAYARLIERAAKISDRNYRKMFVEQLPENARTIELARDLGVNR